MVEFAAEAYLAIVVSAVPVAVIFEFGNMAVGTFLRAAFGGKLWIGR